MNEYFQQIGISYGMFFLITLLLFFLVGLLFIRIIPSLRSDNDLFIRFLNLIMVGITIVIPVFAIIWSKGNSVMWLAILLWIFFFIKHCPSKEMSRNLKIKRALTLDYILILVVSCIIYFAFYAVFFIRGAGSFFFDFQFYGNAIVHMLDTHSESVNFLGIMPIPSMYHYGELWISAFIASIFSLKPIYVLILITYPLCAFLCVIGMASICKAIMKTPNWVSLIVGIGILFFIPLPSIGSYGALVDVPKKTIMALFVIWSVANYLNKNKLIALVSILMSVPFYSTIAPGILMFCFCFEVYEQSKDGIRWKSIFNIYTMVTMLVAVLYVLFYSIQITLPYSESHEFLYEGSWLLNSLIFLLKRTARFVIEIIPICLILFLIRRKCEKEDLCLWMVVTICLFVSVIVSSAVGGVMKQVSRDGGQIFTNYMMATLNIFLYSAILYLIRILLNSHKNIQSLLLVIISICCTSYYMFARLDTQIYPLADKQYNERQYNILNEKIKEDNPIIGGFYLNGKRYFSLPEYDMMPNITKSGFFSPFDLSCLHVSDNVPKVLDDSHSRALYQFVQIQKKEETYVSDEQSITEFIELMQIKFLIVQNQDEIPEKYRECAHLLVQFPNSSIYQIVP